MGVILGFGVEAITIGAIAFGVIVAAFSLLLKEWQSRSRRPFSGRPLRPPGETLRIKLDQLNEQLLLRLALLMVVLFPTITISENALKAGNPHKAIGVCALGVAVILGLVIWIWRFALRMSHYALGFDGERAVGEELNRLMLDGCQVFHDLEMDGIGNIDHVVVAPHAVYAVETKAKRKRARKSSGEESHKVTFTGDTMVYPFGTDVNDLKQARKSAQTLAAKLEQLTKSTVPVKPVLVVPGWYIERTGKSDVAVVNDKRSQLRSVIVDQRAVPMNEKLREQICALLEDWSRQSMEP